MKKIIFLIGLIGISGIGESQILKKIADRAKNRVENNVNNKVNNTVDKTVDDAMNPTINKDKTSGDAPKDQNNTVTDNKTSAASVPLKIYSKYDFVPGEKIIAFEDFAQDAVGDFPAKWNTDASAEVVTIEGKDGRWLKITKQGIFMPEYIDALPEDFTLEFDLLCDNISNVWAFYTSITALDDRNLPRNWQSSANRFTFIVAPHADGGSLSLIERAKNGVGESSATTSTKQFSNNTIPVHIAIWRQKERIRVYFNEEKTWDLPRTMSADAKYNALVYWMQGATEDGNYYLSNLRLAVGAPDTRKKILEQKKWVTHGILFDVNSDKIKPESYGTLKEMASVMQEYTDLKVRIIGHTDADGKDDANLDLSKRRAAAVRAALAKEFGIEESRMETDGKGETEPIDKNDSPAGKANNRRVEFIKL